MRGRKDGTEDVDEHGRRLSLFTKDLNKLALDPSHGGAMTVKEYWLTGMPGYMSIAYKDAAPVAEAYGKDSVPRLCVTKGCGSYLTSLTYLLDCQLTLHS
eukprot:GHVQ01010368.1.p1 GENE.GHVQ01010368.1~~GHVQ01010368.1.p1  ORF type:complete len:100 (-),score=10.43 GHVQ01010368.1:203-502(-)